MKNKMTYRSKRKEYKRITQKEEDLIIDSFLTLKNNTVKEISIKTNLTESVVSRVISKHLENKFKKT